MKLSQKKKSKTKIWTWWHVAVVWNHNTGERKREDVLKAALGLMNSLGYLLNSRPVWAI